MQPSKRVVAAGPPPTLKLRAAAPPMTSASQIIPHLFVGGCEYLWNEGRLRQDHITHVLVCASEVQPKQEPSKRFFAFKSIPLEDEPTQEIIPYFEEAFAFIDDALKTSLTNNVLVCCALGASRSASIVIAYLIKTQRVPYQEALNFVKQVRYVVQPNSGFERQLQLFADMGGDAYHGSTQQHLLYAALRLIHVSEQFNLHARFHSLHVIDFSGQMQVTDAMLGVIGRMCWLTKLDVSNTRVSDTGIEYFCEAREQSEAEARRPPDGRQEEEKTGKSERKGQEQRRKLLFEDTDADTDQLSGVEGCENETEMQHLRHTVQMSNTHMSSPNMRPAAKDGAASVTVSPLRVLHLHGTSVTDIGMRILCESCVASSLSTLALSPRVTNASVQFLCSGMRALTGIDISFTSLSGETVDMLFASLPLLRCVHADCTAKLTAQELAARAQKLTAARIKVAPKQMCRVGVQQQTEQHKDSGTCACLPED